VSSASLESDPSAAAGERPAVAAFERHYAAMRRSRRWQTGFFVAVFLAVLAFSIEISGFYPERLIEGAPRVGEYFHSILPVLTAEDLLADHETEGSIAYWYFNLPLYLSLLWETFNMALCATMLGAAGAFLLSFPASRNLAPNLLTYHITRRVMEFCRGVPEILYALIFVYAFGVGPLAGILAIAVHTVGALGKLFSEVNENIDHGPIEGVRAAGGNWFEAMGLAVVPQVLPNFTSYALLRFEINVRASAIVGFVGAGGIGQELYYVISFNYHEEVSAILLLMVLTVTAIDLVSERLRHRFIGRENLA